MGLQDTRGDEAEALVWSACSAMVETALKLLATEPRLARHDLATAAVCGEAEIVGRMVAAEPARANTFFTPMGRTPLHYATFSRLGRRDPERQAALRSTVAALLENGADPNVWFTHDGWVQAPVYGAAGIAGDAEMTRMLLEAGANPNDVGPDQRIGEALYHATEMADPACAVLLIRAGTDARAVRHCLGRALNFDNPAMVEAFCENGARPRAAHLHQAVWCRRGPRTVTALLSAGAPVDEPDSDHGLTALQVARRWGDGEVVELLAGAGADAGPDPELDPDAAGQLTDDMLIAAIQRGDLADVRRLLDAGAQLDGSPRHGDDAGSVETPLGQACWRGRAEIVAELLSRGASTTFPDGGSALGASRHGAGHCNDPEGGATMATAEEIDPAPYAEIEQLIRAADGLAAVRGGG